MFDWKKFKYRKYIKIAKENNLYFEDNPNMELFNYISSGSEGIIYKYNNIIRKIYKRENYELIKMIKLHNKFYSNKRQIVGLIKKDKYFFIEESPFIEGKGLTKEDIKNIHKIDSNFIIKNNYLFDTKNKIYIIDTYYGNVIKNKKGIFFIDTDYYKPYKLFITNIIMLIILPLINKIFKYLKNILKHIQ